MRFLSAALVLLAFLGLTVVESSAIGVEVALGGWNQTPDGEVSYKSPLASDGIDLDNEARYDEENRLYGRAKIDLPVFPNIYLMGTPMEFEGTGVKAVGFTFGDQTYAADVPFYSRLKLDQYDLGFYYGVPLLGTASLRTLNVDFGINIKMLDVEAEVRQPGFGTDSTSETFYIPMGFLALQFKPVKKLAFEVELRGIGYSGNHYYDLIGRVRFNIAGPVFGAAGLRHQEVEIDEEDILADLEFTGPFAELGLRF